MTRGARFAQIAMGLLIASTLAAQSRAASIETLLMPGPVSRAHEEIEGQCASCHDRTDRSRQSALCLDCHGKTAADVRAGTGFHGRLRARDTGQCQACHTEHRGRDAAIARISGTTFDHARTDFPLVGAHLAVACENCHAPGRQYREAPANCAGCHERDDTHHGQLGSDCGSCHRAQSWVLVGFDHERTKFPLREAHRNVACGACHVGGRHRSTPRECVACHTPDDVHRGSRGTQCAECHSTASWNTTRFDHAKTGFPLLGRHASADCADCHRDGRLEAPLPRECSGCHLVDDRHAGRFGAGCEQCHSNDTWRLASFDHFGRAHFRLTGAHAAIACHDCHATPIGAPGPAKDCAGCHRAIDVHGAQLGDCQKCHGQEHWRGDIAFDHELTSFPLLGLHVALTCSQCHTTLAFRDAPTGCNDCHAQADVHRGSMGADCASCHSPNGWDLWTFDHRERTHFALTGRHEALACADCHTRPAAQLELSTECAACHAGDDTHAGRFGRQCDRCHSTSSFQGARAR